MQQTWKVLVIFIGILFSFDGYAGVTDCRNEWARPSSQTMSMDSAISFSLTDYKSGERHFSVKQNSGQGAEIYYLKGAILVKGYSEAQIGQLRDGLFMMPMAFAVPVTILAETAPKGPCHIEEKTPVSIQLSGGMRLQDRRLTGAVGQLSPSALSGVSYELDISIDPPAPNKKSVRYSGAMSFDPQQESLPDDTDVTGYMVVARTRPFPIAGSSGVPAKLGELKRFLVPGQASSKSVP